MTAHELLTAIRDAGGRVSVADGCQLDVERVPKRFVPELRRLKIEIVSHLRSEAAANPFSHAQFVGYGFYKLRAALQTDPVLQRLAGHLNLKPVSPERLREIEYGQQWRSVSASNLEPANQPHWNGSRYRWQRVCHYGSCNGAIEIPGYGRGCSRCYPFANGGGGRLAHVTGKCAASIHALVKRKVDDSCAFFAEHILWAAGERQEARRRPKAWELPNTRLEKEVPKRG